MNKMLRTTYFQLLAGAFLLAVSPAAFSQNVWLTDKQFQNRGVGEFTGTITSVQISSSTQSFESGTVQLQVNQVIAGTVTTPKVTFAFQRTLMPTDFLSNWDLVAPFGASLETAVGDELLLFVTESSGVYSIYPASNSVQAINQGLLVGKILSVHSHDGDSGRNRDDAIDVEIQVSETVYGWVNGTTVTLTLQKHSPNRGDVAHRGAGYAPIASMLNSLGGGNDPASADKAGLLDESGWGANGGKQFVVAFVNGTISGLEIASKEFLSTLQTLDSE
jgi:hypothetical protein